MATFAASTAAESLIPEVPVKCTEVEFNLNAAGDRKISMEFKSACANETVIQWSKSAESESKLYGDVNGISIATMTKVKEFCEYIYAEKGAKLVEVLGSPDAEPSARPRLGWQKEGDKQIPVTLASKFGAAGDAFYGVEFWKNPDGSAMEMFSANRQVKAAEDLAADRDRKAKIERAENTILSTWGIQEDKTSFIELLEAADFLKNKTLRMLVNQKIAESIKGLTFTEQMTLMKCTAEDFAENKANRFFTYKEMKRELEEVKLKFAFYPAKEADGESTSAAASTPAVLGGGGGV